MHLAALGAEPARRFVLVRTDQRNRPPVLGQKKKEKACQRKLVEGFAENRIMHPGKLGSRIPSKKQIDFRRVPARNQRTFANETNLR